MGLKVAWLPAHPVDGSESMLRYWRALRRETALAAGRIDVVEPFGPPPERAQRAGAWRRAWSKRVLYPWQVGRLPAVEVVHLLDHSFAHVLPRVRAGTPVVATVHDLAPLEAGEGLTEGQVRRFRAAVARLTGVARLVVPSEFTARQVVERLGFARERIVVLPMGVDLERFTPSEPTRSGPYVISVGSCSPRKNLGLLPAMLRRVVTAVPGLSLVRAGEPLPEALRRDVADAVDGRLVELGRVDDGALPGLYAGALALVVPSTLEGFGLPVLEAMACGCPVVCSRAASLPEAGGDAALYFDPADAAAAADHVVALAGTASQRRELVERGLARARRFSWSAHAAGLERIYREVAVR